MLPGKITVAFVKEDQMISMDLWVHNAYIIGCRNAEFIL